MFWVVKSPDDKVNMEELSWICFWQTNELVMSLDDDEKLILQNDQTLREAGVGESHSMKTVLLNQWLANVCNL